MERLKSIDSFRTLQARLIADSDQETPTLVVSAGTCGQASGANDLIRIAKREILAKGLTDKIHLRITGCQGFCQMDPSVLIEPRSTFYPRVSIENMVRIIDAVAKGEVLQDLLYVDPKTGKPVEKESDLPFFKGQIRNILGSNEKVDPIRVFNYIERGGYSALVKVLEKGKPEWVIDAIKKSGLRGRGGAGFPTGRKWELLSKQGNEGGKFLVCNADEGDPGAYMDRSVIEGNPHSIIEGMIIGAYATGATDGVVYVRHEYPLAIKHLLIALRQARELGLLGKDILGTGFTFDISLIRGAGAFVCGEETALMRSVEGNVGEPYQRPPYPVQRGIDGRPTVINNVETWANIPFIMRIGASEFTKVGTKNNSGTKIFSLVGKIKNTGLVEVPMGITVDEIVNRIGGGPSGRAKIKAVQTGGPSGGCIPARKFDLTIDYDSLTEAGSIMGSGGMIVMDENTCVVDVAKYYMKFLKDESCGKCFTCRKGTQRMWEILDDISAGRGTFEQLELLEELALVVKDTTMCGLGQTASNPVLSTLRYFRDEYIEHIKNRHCPAGVCKDLVGAPCQSACPIGTEAWRYVAHIARGEEEEAYQAIREANPFPSVCARVCNHPCEGRCRSGTIGGEAIAIRPLKRFVTERMDPSVFKPKRVAFATENSQKIAIVGAGPAGLTAAHYLSLRGYKVTVFEKESKPGGMLFGAIPAYRLPKEIIEKEIESILDENITVKCNAALGTNFTLDSLFQEGYGAIFLALGAHKSKMLKVEGENSKGVFPSIEFLKDFNLRGKRQAKGRVGVIGGGNSAIDAARVAIRQKEVSGVTIYYRRTREEMPGFEEEIEAAIQEGVKLEPLTSPVRIISEEGRVTGIELLKNELGDMDSSGRRKPVPVPGSEFTVALDTIISAISEGSDVDCISVASSMKIDTTEWETVKVDPETLCTNQPGVFAGGDVVRGPNTVVEAIADGKRAALVIDRYLRGEELKQPTGIKLPDIYVEPAEVSEECLSAKRVETPRALVEWRKRGFAEVEMSLTVEEARCEALRCLRCDLEFTEPKAEEEEIAATGGKTA
ncbi:MAG: FAD-dependent oxidoreductase [Candidatus Eisenbacteria bacterium]|nr:FAD-dependent oxidoreductase [Candidatus Eisenbacteria bacterium]